MSWLVWMAAAWGLQADDEALQEMARELMPHVETLAGRRFLHQPTVGFIRRRDLRRAYLDRPPRIDEPDPALEERRLDDDEVAQLSRTAAVYSRTLDGVFVIRESAAEIQERYRLTEPEIESYLRCTLVHELAHALQDQYGELYWTHTEGRRALLEGHATVIEAQWCDTHEAAPSSALSRASSHADLISSVVSEDPSAPYAYGSVFVEALNEREPALVWAALAGSPPEWADVVDAVEPARMPRWDVVAPVEHTLRGLKLSHEAYPPFLTDPLDLLHVRLELPLEHNHDPRGVAGFGQVSGLSYYMAYVAATVVPPGMSAADTIRRRARAVRNAEDVASIAVFAQRIAPIQAAAVREAPVLIAHPDVSDAFFVVLKTTRKPYRELWAAKGRTLAMIATYGPSAGLGKLQRHMSQLLHALPEVEEPGPVSFDAMSPWLAQLADAPAHEVMSASFRLHRAAVDVGNGVARPCARWFDDALASDFPAPRSRFVRSAIICAAATADDPLVDRALHHAHGLEVDLGVRVATAYLEAGAPDRCSAVLDKVARGPDAELDTSWTALRASCRNAVQEGETGR